jgi:hypothetical protein
MKESEISEIAKLFKNDRVHVVDIRVSFSGNGHHQLLSDLHVKLLNPIGEEILHALADPQVNFVTWTLKAGLRYFKLDVEESHNDCVDREENIIDFAFKIVQNIVSSVNLETNYEVWYSFKETSSGEIRQICCHIKNNNLSKCNDELCSNENSFLYGSDDPLNTKNVIYHITSVVMIPGLLCGITLLLFALLFRSEFDRKYPKYYKLEESMMSPFSIFFKIAGEESGGKISFLRSCLSHGAILYFLYLRLGQEEVFDTFILPIFFFWGLIVSIPCLYKPKITKLYLLTKIKKERNSYSLHYVYNSNVLRLPISAGSYRRIIIIIIIIIIINKNPICSYKAELLGLH